MKAEIHPAYNEVNIECVCGTKYKTRSTKEITKIDICAACHPFYSGKERVMDTEGRIEKFRKKFGEGYKTKK